MGNIGRSSTGCYLCRKRKIKCDEGKPGCRKCAIIRKDCPGYPFSVELKIRTDPDVKVAEILSTEALPASYQDQSPLPNPNVIRATQDVDEQLPVIPIILSPRHQGQSKEEATGNRETLELVPQYRSPTPPPKYDVQHQSTCFFLNLFCFQANRLYGAGVIDYLPAMLSNAKPDTCLYQATMAVSRLTLADRYSGHDVRLQTGKEYGEALAKTNATIRNKSQAIMDETVVAVWLLGLYENIGSVLSHGRASKDVKTPAEEYQSHISHIRGALNLLRIRGQSQLTTARAEKIYRVFKAAIQMRLFMLNCVTSTDFENLEQDIRKDEHEFLPSETARRATDYFHSVVHLMEKIKYALRRMSRSPDPTANIIEMQDLFLTCEKLDGSMSNWSKADAGWDMMKITVPTTGTMWSFYPSHALYFFYNFFVYLYWLRYLIARVKLYEGLILASREQKKFLTRIQSGYKATAAQIARLDFKMSQYRTIFQLAVAEIIGLTAYALGDVTNSGTFLSSSRQASVCSSREVNALAAMQLVIPLKLLQRSEFSTPVQKGAIDLALGHIGDGFRRQPISQ